MNKHATDGTRAVDACGALLCGSQDASVVEPEQGAENRSPLRRTRLSSLQVTERSGLFADVPR